MQAMILAAGFGTRLLPYTSEKPKPLFPLLNIPLLQLTVHNLREAGFDHIIVNAHHLSKQIRTLTDTLPGVTLQEEKTILGTGGGLRLALEKFRNEPILVTNGDIYHSIDLQNLYLQHTRSREKVTLAVHDYSRFNSMILNGRRLKSFDGVGIPGSVAFTGLHVVEPEVLMQIPAGEKSCIIERYKNLLLEGGEIAVIRADGTFWADMGTPADYLDLHGGLQLGKVPCYAMLESRSKNRIFISNKAALGKNIEFQDWACIGAAVIGDNVKIERSVVWDGAYVRPNSVITDAIIR